MITIFHGDDFVNSRQTLNQSLSLKPDRFNAKDLTQEALTQVLESSSLFGDEKTIVIDNLLTLRPSKQKDALTNIVLKNQDKNVLLWEQKAITPAVKKKFSKAKIQEFKLKANVFKFLDSIQPNSSKQSLVLLHQTLIKDPVELVFYFFSRRISQLIQTKDNHGLKGAPWQIGKLKSQTKAFSLDQLINLHQKLADIDFQIKSGQTDVSLTTQLDLLLLTI